MSAARLQPTKTLSFISLSLRKKDGPGSINTDRQTANRIGTVMFSSWLGSNWTIFNSTALNSSDSLSSFLPSDNQHSHTNRQTDRQIFVCSRQGRLSPRRRPTTKDRNQKQNRTDHLFSFAVQFTMGGHHNHILVLLSFFQPLSLLTTVSFAQEFVCLLRAAAQPSYQQTSCSANKRTRGQRASFSHCCCCCCCRC